MKYNIRWQLLLALLGIGLVWSLLSFQVQTAGLCSTRVPAAGGTFTEGILGAPQYLNPLLSDNFPVDREIVSLVFDGLTRYDESGKLVPDLAQSWTVSEDGLTIQFTLRQDVTWHDGEPFTADDVAFTYRLLQDEEFLGPDALKTLWQAVTITQPDLTTIQFTLPEAYAPFLDATTRGILPAHRLQGVTAATLVDAPFNQSPVGTGPFMVNPGQEWQRNQRLRFSLNPTYWRQETQIANLEFRFFPDNETMIDAFMAGEIQAINNVSYQMLPKVAAIPGSRLFTASSPRYSMLLFNMNDSGSPALQEAETRKAMAYALDREALIDQIYNGQGLLLEGPYLPTSWAYHPQLLTNYQSNPLTATVMLESAGWTLPEGSTIRQQDDTLLELRLLALNEPLHRDLAEAIEDQLADVGVMTQLTLVPNIDALLQALKAQEFDMAIVEVAPPGDPDFYDFWSQEAIIRGQNFGGWNQRRASEALENGRKLWDVEERRPFYDIFLSRYDNNLPALTLYQHVYSYALSGDVNRAEIGVINHPRDRYKTVTDWFLLYRDVTISCSPEGA